MQHDRYQQKPTIRARLAIAPDDLALSGLYKHLVGMETDRARAMALRLVLSSKRGFSPDLEMACSGLPTISVRITISERDAGISDLHEAMVLAQTDAQRRALLKNAIVRIQAAAMQVALPHATNEVQAQAATNAASFARTDQHVTPTIDRPPALLPSGQIAPGSEAPIPEAAPITTAMNQDITPPAVKNPSFKSRMRDASRMFDA